jgi:hypothetical protein
LDWLAIIEDSFQTSCDEASLVKEVFKWMPLMIVSEVRSFLALDGYYRRFITELLKKGNMYVWSESCDEAFKHLKKLLTTSPVLAQPDTTKLFDVYCDASGTDLGGVLMQEG